MLGSEIKECATAESGECAGWSIGSEYEGECAGGDDGEEPRVGKTNVEGMEEGEEMEKVGRVGIAGRC